MQREMPDFGALAQKIDQKREQFEAFYSLLLAYNAKFNLTAVTEREKVFHKHFLDSVAGEGFLPEGAVCAEVGSGAGFPSLPLKIIRSDLKVTLVESTGKKCGFLRTAVRELGLQGVEVVEGRAETLGRDPKFRERFDVCFARAVARLNTLAEYCMPLVRVGGEFLAYKGEAAEEITTARKALSVLGGGEIGCAEYELPRGYGKRTLVFVKKIAPTPRKFPRGQGLERRDPIA